MKKLTRIPKDRMIAGVCAGVSEYTGMDTTMVRLIFVLIALLSGVVPMIIFYVVAALIIPEE